MHGAGHALARQGTAGVLTSAVTTVPPIANVCTPLPAPHPSVCPAVLKEALRRYSVVPVVTRSLKEDDVLGGHTVPAGSMVVCHIQVRGLSTQCRMQPGTNGNAAGKGDCHAWCLRPAQCLA
jgi:hypothetical protein